jgi:hypothetical protein
MNRFVLITIAVVSLLVVAGAVFVGARLLNAPGEGDSLLNAPGLFIQGAGPGLGGVMVKFDLKPAPELPQTLPEVNGLFDHREDNSIFVGTGKISFSVTKDQATGQKTSSSSSDGPPVEIVVTHDTTLYLDTTEMPSPGSGATSGVQTVQQTVKPVDSLDDLDKNTYIQVWGHRSGDRVVAQVVVYRPIMGKGAGSFN